MTLYTEQKNQMKAPNFEAIPQELKDHSKWMPWKTMPTKYNPNILGKVPCGKTGYPASKSDPENWLTFKQAQTYYLKHGLDGVGIVINRNDRIVCMDLDNFEDMNNIPAEKYNLTIHSYTEYSPSEKGLHIFIKGQKPKWAGTKANGVEVYGSEGESFITVTGNTFHPTPMPVKENQPLIDIIAKKYLKKKESTRGRVQPQNGATVPDIVVLTKMFQSKNGQVIKGLFDGDISKYESHSDADMGLCNHLAYWTNNNTIQMDRIFRQSALFRDKWDEKRQDSTYGDVTINEAIAGKGGGSK
jgi:primase-polymerase (primpol)-like protein